MKIYQKLRKKYPLFIYKSYSFSKEKNYFKINFFFEIPPRFDFKTTILIKKVPDIKNDLLLENLIFHLGLIEMLNYWKLTCSPKIQILANGLDKNQVRFLKKIIIKGMGQYFYENKIDDFAKPNFLSIKTKRKKQKEEKIFQKKIKRKEKKILIPIGGGKDSIVTLEIFRKKNNFLGTFILNPQKPNLEIIKTAKTKENIFVERKLDPLLLKLNKRGFLNGHVPFSAFLSFLSLIIAYIFNYQKVAFSWEKSSSEPNLKYKGKWINHQWSKSLEFEKMFREYNNKYLLKNVKVFSPIRSFSELKIAKIFSKLKKYHFIFLSCNKAYAKKNKKIEWCQKCPKCLFTFLILYPFLNEKRLIKIFGKNLLENKKLLPIMRQLIGKEKFKPFECVGSKKEIISAISIIKRKKLKLPSLLLLL